jgi:Polyketide cyclase / dehydrase and lipid transport
VSNRIAVAIDIDARPADVWADVAPIEHHVRWMRDAVAIHFATQQARGVGTRFRVDTRIGPLRLTDEMTVTDWVEGELIGVRHTGAVTGTGQFTLVPGPTGGTRFAWTEELRFPWWLGGPAGGAIGQRLLAPVWRRNLRDLKEQVEASHGESRLP